MFCSLTSHSVTLNSASGLLNGLLIACRRYITSDLVDCLEFFNLKILEDEVGYMRPLRLENCSMLVQQQDRRYVIRVGIRFLKSDVNSVIHKSARV